ncbi:hypothetical protein I4F81_003481 [Pyropia yezoensis]|uniref:Uncharacterized protein n=1 Tax=Pyropia yezoensis TaxID=2788 RepID=A0ACC3BSB2_PYRYE|nr:hypothetical protein I4F81_003481 [Neopyropia yezoensis]
MTELLLLDEASMESSRLFTALVYCMNAARTEFCRAAMWRMIAFGDYYQLPPVYNMEEEDKLFDIEASSAFESAAWPTLLQQSMLELTYVWRQADQQLMEMLADLRIGTVSQDLAAFLDERKQHYEDAIRSNDGWIEDATHIFPLYVALSRIRSMDGVFVKYFAPERARADSVVQAFSAKQGSLADEHADCTSFPESAVL